MRILVIGEKGQVARCLREVASNEAGIDLMCTTRSDCDLAVPRIATNVLDFRPDVIVNPAAYTAVDRAEREASLAFKINRDGARLVAEVAAKLDIPIIHFSTDYVFDGFKNTPYVESDPAFPSGVYGRSKLEGEKAVAQVSSKHVILRTSWVFAPMGHNFVRTILRLMSEKDHLRVVNDQAGCPSYAPDIASAVIRIAARIARDGWHPEFAGVTHLAGPDAVTWFGFAQMIVDQAALIGKRPVSVEPISSDDYPTDAPRPRNSRLSTDHLRGVFGIELLPLKQSLTACLRALSSDTVGG